MNNRQRIMVIDDDRDMQELLNRSLDMEGFDTVIVADSDSALNIMDKVDPDLIILDTTGPDNESFEALDHVRECSSVPIIMLTSQYEVELLRKAISLGADDLVRKPLGMRSFIARIRAKLRRSQLKIH